VIYIAPKFDITEVSSWHILRSAINNSFLMSATVLMIVVTFDSFVNLVSVLFVGFCFNLLFYLCCHLTNKVV